LINVVVFLGVDTRPSTWLFNLNMRYWSIHAAIILWVTAIWLTAELTDSAEDYLPLIRILAVICILPTVVFGLHSFFSATTPGTRGYSIWWWAVAVATICCAVRSLWLLYVYRYEGEESIDMEEAQWFWGMSGFLFAVLIILGLMHIIYVKTPSYPGMDTVGYTSLFISFRDSLNLLIRNGAGSMAVRALGFLIFTGSVAFIYVAGKWALIYLSRIKASWE